MPPGDEAAAEDRASIPESSAARGVNCSTISAKEGRSEGSPSRVARAMAARLGCVPRGIDGRNLSSPTAMATCATTPGADWCSSLSWQVVLTYCASYDYYQQLSLLKAYRVIWLL